MDNLVFDDGQYYVYPRHMLHELFHSFWNFEEAPHTIPVISVVGAGPQGPRGEKGDTGKISFGRDDEDSAIWDNSKPYEKNTFVVQGEHIYVAIQNVPAGILIDNETYWRRYDFTTTGIESLRHDLDAEIANRQAGDSDEATLRAQGDAELSQSIMDETSARQIEDADLSRRINNEADARIAGDAANATAISDEGLARQQGDADLQSQLDNVYTKAEADNVYQRKAYSSDDILLCIGDDNLVGYSPENPSGIQAWDVYLGQALGFNPLNIVKVCERNSGFVVGTVKISNLITQSSTVLTNAGKSASNVKLVVIGAGVIDLRDYTTTTVEDNFGAAVAAAVNSVKTLYPNAEVHVFPLIMGNYGLCDRVSFIENDAHKAVLKQEADSDTTSKVELHRGVWSWNYDGNDSGVSTDRYHLLSGGQKLVGLSMAQEINGVSAYNNGHKFNVWDIAGNTFTYGVRNGTMASFSVDGKPTTSGSKEAIGMDMRYGTDSVFVACLSNGSAVGLHYNMNRQYWYSPIAAENLWGTHTWHIQTLLEDVL